MQDGADCVLLIAAVLEDGLIRDLEALAQELGPHGINVTVVHPGVTETERTPDAVAARDHLDAAQAVGLKPGDVRRQASQLIAGEEAGDIFRAGKAFDVQLWSTPDTRENVTDVRTLLLTTPSGEHVRLEERELFPLVERTLPPERLRTLGEELRAAER